MACEYRLGSSANALTADNLLAEPFPAEFQDQVNTENIGLNGAPIPLGYPTATWRYQNQYLTAAAWNQLMSFLGGALSAVVYIRTRTNFISSGAYEYKSFQARMHRPTGKPYPGFRYEDVEVPFTHLIAV